MDNFYRSFVRALRQTNPAVSLQINNIQQDLSESIPFKLLNTLLPKAIYYSNVYYKAPTGANGRIEWCECDGVVIYDDVMIIVEVKAGALSPATPFIDEDAYKNSLKQLAENPYLQTIRFYNEYIKSNKIEIYSKKEKKKYELLSEIKEMKFIQSCCITLENFNEITAQIEKTNLIQSLPLPIWCISISDLRVYAEILDSPSHFLNFLYQRSKALKNPKLKLNDELDHLGMYLSYNDYSNHLTRIYEDTVKSDNAKVELFIDNHREEIDVYMALRYSVNDKQTNENLLPLMSILYEVENFPTGKPNQVIPIELQELINLLEKSSNIIDIRVNRYLLMFDSYTRENIAEFLKSRKAKLIQNRYKNNFYIPYAAYNYTQENRIPELPVIMILIIESANKLFKDVVSRKRFLMERVVDIETITYCVLIGVNKQGIFNKVLTHIIEPYMFEALNPQNKQILNTARENIVNSRVFIELN